jgi:hypothetical protein
MPMNKAEECHAYEASSTGACRGRKERLAFADSFQPAYHFRLLYASNAMMYAQQPRTACCSTGCFAEAHESSADHCRYPIRGALRYSYGGQWEVHSASAPRKAL